MTVYILLVALGWADNGTSHSSMQIEFRTAQECQAGDKAIQKQFKRQVVNSMCLGVRK